MKVKRCTASDRKTWLELRLALWPDCDPAEHEREIRQQLDEPERFLALLVIQRGKALGLAEASLRSDHVNGTESSPVAFLEGLYVDPPARRQGVAGLLVQAVRDWALQAGVTELASDAAQENLLGQRIHRALGFRETERVVYYRMPL
jgi:aminoglycoside 6'-N-acetyltransferase I